MYKSTFRLRRKYVPTKGMEKKIERERGVEGAKAEVEVEGGGGGGGGGGGEGEETTKTEPRTFGQLNQVSLDSQLGKRVAYKTFTGTVSEIRNEPGTGRPVTVVWDSNSNACKKHKFNGYELGLLEEVPGVVYDSSSSSSSSSNRKKNRENGWAAKNHNATNLRKFFPNRIRKKTFKAEHEDNFEVNNVTGIDASSSIISAIPAPTEMHSPPHSISTSTSPATPPIPNPIPSLPFTPSEDLLLIRGLEVLSGGHLSPQSASEIRSKVSERTSGNGYNHPHPLLVN